MIGILFTNGHRSAITLTVSDKDPDAGHISCC